MFFIMKIEPTTVNRSKVPFWTTSQEAKSAPLQFRLST